MPLRWVWCVVFLMTLPGQEQSPMHLLPPTSAMMIRDGNPVSTVIHNCGVMRGN